MVYRRLRRWLSVVVLISVIVARLAVSGLYGFYGFYIYLSMVSPPLVFYWDSSGDGEDVSAVLGANATSFSATVKATVGPNTVCNPNMSIAVVSAGGGVYPFCWLMGAANLTPSWGSESYDSAGGSAVFYNDSSIVIGWGDVLVYRAVLAQVFLEPSTVLYDDIDGNHYLGFCISLSVDSLLGVSSEAYVNVTIYSPATGVSYTGATDVSTFIGRGWVCLSGNYTPVNSVDPAYYVLLVEASLTVTAAGFLAVVRNVTIMFDSFYHTLNLTVPGVYYSMPAFEVNESVLGFNSSLVLGSASNIAAEVAWIADPFSVPVSRPLVYMGGSTPVATGPANLSDTLGVGVLVFYQAYTSLPGGGHHNFTYTNGAVSVYYPVNISGVDPAPGLPGGNSVVRLVLEPRPLRSPPYSMPSDFGALTVSRSVGWMEPLGMGRLLLLKR